MTQVEGWNGVPWKVTTLIIVVACPIIPTKCYEDRNQELPDPLGLPGQEDKSYDAFIKQLTTTAEAKTDSTYFVLIDSGNKHALDYFGIKAQDCPAYVIQHGAKKFIKHHSKPKEAAAYYKDFLVGRGFSLSKGKACHDSPLEGWEWGCLLRRSAT